MINFRLRTTLIFLAFVSVGLAIPTRVLLIVGLLGSLFVALAIPIVIQMSQSQLKGRSLVGNFVFGSVLFVGFFLGLLYIHVAVMDSRW